MAELPDLIAITDGEPEWTWDVCIVCGSAEIAHCGLYVRPSISIGSAGKWEVSRVAWCAGDVCQADRLADTDTVLVNAAPTREDQHHA